MKSKILTPVVFLFFTEPAFAYGSSDENGTNTLIIVMLVIFGIINLILFFKIWGMTSNVKKLKDHFAPDDPLKDQINLFILMDEYDKAKDLLCQNFYKEIYKQYLDI